MLSRVGEVTSRSLGVVRLREPFALMISDCRSLWCSRTTIRLPSMTRSPPPHPGVTGMICDVELPGTFFGSENFLPPAARPPVVDSMAGQVVNTYWHAS